MPSLGTSSRPPTWKALAEKTLASPDTWEVSLSATKGENKREAWERLLAERKLGPLALIRNLRNFVECQVPGGSGQAAAKPGLGYGAWHHIDGWSDAVLAYIRENERASE